MEKKFYSNGKLLITGEYVVLDGALALALPTKFGQDLVVEQGKNKEIVWKSYDSDGSIWFEETIPFLDVIHNSNFENKPEYNTLISILHEGYLLNPDFITNSDGCYITTHLTFPKFWGLGTSSTLINNIAQWLAIDAYTLLKNSFGGSGYDIACAQNKTPILYQLVKGKPIVKKTHFNPEYTKNIYFVYLNKKQSSKNAIADYFKKQKNDVETISKISNITNLTVSSKNIDDFISKIESHETILSKILDTNTVKEELFSDFNGAVKSLGAWGGDFVLVVSKDNPKDYFKEKGYQTIIAYQDMIL